MSRPRRLAHFSYRGPHRYSLTFCTRNRAHVFVDASVVCLALLQFRTVANAEQFAILAYCFMPDHVHLVVEGLTDGADLLRFTKMAKQRAGAAFAMAAGSPLWQEGYHEHVLRADEDVKSVIRYVLANPVRGDLVASPKEYPYLGSDRWALDDLLGSV
jgi:putative transposase